MVENDGQVGQLLKELDELGITNNTIVIFTTDNGAETFTWPDGGTTPFRSKKHTIGKAAIASPRWCGGPARLNPAPKLTTSSRPRIGSLRWPRLPGIPDVANKLTQGYDGFTVHLDGYDETDLLAGKGLTKRHEFFYWTDDGDLAGLRYDKWKIVFVEQQAHGLGVWQQPLITLRAPKIFNLRTDPFERADYKIRLI